MAKAKTVADELNRLADPKKIEDYLKKEGLKFESATYQRGDRLAGFPAAPGPGRHDFRHGREHLFAPR